MIEKYSDEQIEEIFNDVCPGLMGTHRDTYLPKKIVDKYKKGMIIRERGFVDASVKESGFTGNCRFFIASTKFKKMPSLLVDRGHCMLTSDSYFKILDVLSKGGKTQILLLHIPKETADLFSKISVDVDDDVIKYASTSFENTLDAEPLAVLNDDEWKERTEAPVGMGDDGEFFEL